MRFVYITLGTPPIQSLDIRKMPKLTDMQIRAWIKSGERFEGRADGNGLYLRYRFSCRGDVLKVIQLVNHNAAINEHHGLSQQDISDILNLYPDAFNAA